MGIRTKAQRITSAKFFRLSPSDHLIDLGGLDPIDTYYGCRHDHLQLSAEVPAGFGRYIEKLAREMWERKALAQGYDPVLIQAYGERLTEAVKKGYGKDYVDIDFQTPDYRKLRSLEETVWQFSSAKTYSQLKEMSDALRRPDGTLRTFDEFRVQTALITGRQLRHLKTEYQTAVAGAQMASKWEEIQRMKATYPLLEFIAVEDDHTTALCRSLDGVIRPVDDPLWMQFYPPNHYNCRSTVKQLRKGDVTPDGEIARPNIPDIFKVNLGERGLAFPEDHAYFEGTPPEVMEASRQFYPYNMQMDLLDISDEILGVVRQHYMVDTNAGDYQRNYEIAVERARHKKIIVDLMPTLGREQDKAQRLIVFPDAKRGKSPDLRIDKELWEEERSTNSSNMNNVKNAIDAGYKQANCIFITLSEQLDEQMMYRIANGRWIDHKDLKEIVFRYNGQEWIYKRP